MNSSRRELLRAVLSCPTAPFCERAVVEYIQGWARRRGVNFAQDAAGNVLLSAGETGGAKTRRQAAAKPPWVFSAHMDHPGFVVTGGRSNVVRAEFRGGVARPYFAGARVRLIVRDGGQHVGTIRSARRSKSLNFMACRVELDRPADIPPGTVGMWDVPVFSARKSGRIHARACDDLAGVAAVLAALERIASTGAPGPVLGLLTRAEEVGFTGMLAACKLGTIPPDALVVGIETSKAQPAAPLGGGVVIRVGDRSRVFHEPLTALIADVAAGRAKKTKRFRFVRQLMPGGTCETTALCGWGHTAAALCIALGNYHNQHPRGHVAAEVIDEGDFDCLVDLLVALACEPRTPSDFSEAFRARLDHLLAWREDLLDQPGPWSVRL